MSPFEAAGGASASVEDIFVENELVERGKICVWSSQAANGVELSRGQEAIKLWRLVLGSLLLLF